MLSLFSATMRIVVVVVAVPTIVAAGVAVVVVAFPALITAGAL